MAAAEETAGQVDGEANLECNVSDSFKLDVADSDTIQELSLMSPCLPITAAPSQKTVPLTAKASASAAEPTHVEGTFNRHRASPATAAAVAAATADTANAVQHAQTGSTSPHALSERSADGSRMSGTDSLLGISHATGILRDHSLHTNSASAGGWHSPSGSSVLGTTSPRTGPASSGTSDGGVSPRLTRPRIPSPIVGAGSVAGAGAGGGGGGGSVSRAPLSLNLRDVKRISSVGNSRGLSSRIPGTDHSSVLSGSFFSVASSMHQSHAFVASSLRSSEALLEVSNEDSKTISPESSSCGPLPHTAQRACAGAGAVELSQAQPSSRHALSAHQPTVSGCVPVATVDAAAFDVSITSFTSSQGDPHLAVPPGNMRPTSGPVPTVPEAQAAVASAVKEAEATNSQVEGNEVLPPHAIGSLQDLSMITSHDSNSPPGA